MGLLAINLEMMKTFLLIFILSCILVFSEAKLTKKQKKIVKKFKKVRNQAYDYEETMAALNTTLEDLEKTLSASNRHIFNTDALVVVDATFTGTQCGPFTLTTWSISQNWYSAGNSNDVTVLVSGGIVAAYGSGITEDWLTTGVCFDAYLALNTQVQVRHQSGGSQDCIEYATWPHNKFTVHTIGNG